MICSTTNSIFSDSSREFLRSIWDWEVRRYEAPRRWGEFLLEKGLPKDAVFDDCLEIIKIIRTRKLLDARRPRLQDLLNIGKKLAGNNKELLEKVEIIGTEVIKEAAVLSLAYHQKRNKIFPYRSKIKQSFFLKNKIPRKETLSSPSDI